ncbi:MAG: aminomethyl-transferring glycine dehydrogenase subunit GcvPA, partial [Alphaproteobacteria bacterium]|nr:aminomethyl-transferring glycine dehydrogenase subunit GcvPA [Alphaproteobacteria bacterium]
MRYLPLTDSERRAMLTPIGLGVQTDLDGDLGSGIDALFSDVPEAARFLGKFDLPDHMSEMEVEAAFGALAAKNLSPATAPCFLGGGAYRHHVPASVDHLIQRGEFLTAYTPYQPEISQGTLQTLYEFQTQVALITDMDVANASMYDGATACAEAALMARRVTRRSKAILAGGLHPHYREVTKTACRHLGMTVDTPEPSVEADSDGKGNDITADLIARIDGSTACVVVQNPDVFGNVTDLSDLGTACHAAGALMIVAVTEVVSLGAIVPPGEMGADIVVAEGQSLGNGLNFGGPYLGLFATRDAFVRQMPGRLCGEARDADGRRSYTLTLSTREQHIRREKATSNICTNSGLCGLAF